MKLIFVGMCGSFGLDFIPRRPQSLLEKINVDPFLTRSSITLPWHAQKVLPTGTIGPLKEGSQVQMDSWLTWKLGVISFVAHTPWCL